MLPSAFVHGCVPAVQAAPLVGTGLHMKSAGSKPAPPKLNVPAVFALPPLALVPAVLLVPAVPLFVPPLLLPPLPVVPAVDDAPPVLELLPAVVVLDLPAELSLLSELPEQEALSAVTPAIVIPNKAVLIFMVRSPSR
jgi:hypothetical protein